VTYGGATVSWSTNLPATSEVAYGPASPPGTLLEDLTLTTDHVIRLDGLTECTDYLLSVTSENPGCYRVTDDNGGAYHSFTSTSGELHTLESTHGPRVIPDGLPAGTLSALTMETPYDAVDVKVLVNITHPSTDQIDLYLIGPDGTSVELSTDNGGSGDNYTDTLFDDDADEPITAGSPPFTGAFRPEQPLAAFIGRPAQGDWILRVIDDLGGQVGTLDSWQLRLRLDAPCGALFDDGFESGDTGRWSASAP